jgi:hypothetical protein
MPSVSLVVCVYKERDLLERLLQHAAGCYDDLVVVHDGSENAPPTVSRTPAKPAAINFNELKENAPLPEGYRQPDLPACAGSVQELVRRHGGRYYEGPRAFQQEPHWPFAWGQAKHDWILRLDADEFPSKELRGWLQKFRQSPEPPPEISGYTCIWPLWNGKRAVTQRWPTGRFFLFHRQRVRFFGLAEQTPMADGKCEPLPLVLHHQPRRKSYGVRNLVLRKQAYRWRQVIALSLLGRPTDLPCWRWTNDAWPESWEAIRQRPLRSALFRLIWFPLCNARMHWRYERKVIISDAINPGLHHFLICISYWWRTIGKGKSSR